MAVPAAYLLREEFFDLRVTKPLPFLETSEWVSSKN